MFLDFSGVYEPETVPEGEYQVRVVSAEVRQQKPEKGSGSFIQLKLDIPSAPKSKEITHVMMIPGEKDDAGQRNNRLANIQKFLKSCGYDNVNNIDEVVGCQPWAILAEEETTDFGKQNRVKKFVVGR
jgi:hypothetical protein